MVCPGPESALLVEDSISDLLCPAPLGSDGDAGYLRVRSAADSNSLRVFLHPTVALVRVGNLDRHVRTSQPQRGALWPRRRVRKHHSFLEVAVSAIQEEPGVVVSELGGFACHQHLCNRHADRLPGLEALQNLSSMVQDNCGDGRSRGTVAASDQGLPVAREKVSWAGHVVIVTESQLDALDARHPAITRSCIVVHVVHHHVTEEGRDEGARRTVHAQLGLMHARMAHATRFCAQEAAVDVRVVEALPPICEGIAKLIWMHAELRRPMVRHCLLCFRCRESRRKREHGGNALHWRHDAPLLELHKAPEEHQPGEKHQKPVQKEKPGVMNGHPFWKVHNAQPDHGSSSRAPSSPRAV
mmetsp:Transcript_38450/g.68762  ORF Transcript_38450/g.68762 Transcript_38450/m.68762 type:complete len:356 (-) Transcript_38450:7-1074(-)